MLHPVNISNNNITNTTDIDPPPTEPLRMYRSCNGIGSRCNPADYTGDHCSSRCWRLTVPPPPVMRHHCSSYSDCDLDTDGNPCRVWGGYSKCNRH